MDKEKQLVSYPVEEAEFRPVISIGGREYVVMPYEKIVVLPQEVVDAGALHPEYDSKAFNMNSHAESLLADIMEYLRDAVAVTAVDKGEREDRHEYRLMLPVLMPVDTHERWRRGWTPEREEEFRNAFIERRKTGKPYIFKMVEEKED